MVPGKAVKKAAAKGKVTKLAAPAIAKKATAISKKALPPQSP